VIAPWKDSVELIELISGGLITLGAFVRPQVFSRILREAESGVNRLAAHRTASIVFVGALSMLGSAGVTLATRVPQPAVNDESAHLLAADTFASGRLTNPTHPMWIHFESFHINQKPVYVSKYPPAQGLILAVGQIVTGLPIAGVWLSSGLACAAICWMLQGWFRPGVALIGALLAVLQIGIFSYWTQSYWGGMMAVLGGALVFGGFKRILRNSSVSASIAIACGLAILANSRPFEGLLAALPAFIIIAFKFLRHPGTGRRLMLQKVATPIAVIGLAMAIAMGYYNFRTTGNPLLTAYQLNTATYQVQPIFSWGAFREPPQYNHAMVRKYYLGEELDSAHPGRAIRARAPRLRSRLANLWQFYVGALLAVPFLLGAFAGTALVWPALATVAAVCGGLLLSSVWISPHYAAPMTGPFFVIVTYGWRRLRAYRFRRQRTGLFLARGIVALSVLMLGARVYAAHAHWGPAVPEWPYQRAAIERQFKQAHGQHLILVRYKQTHDPGQEWVYNKADIDRAQVVWAREMDAEHNQALLTYFQNRSVWLVEPDSEPIRLIPYSASSPHDFADFAATAQ
jgi:hypothetical protein